MGEGRGRSPWWVVVGAILGLMVGNGPIMQFTFGVFIKPVSAGLGMERGTASTALMVGLVLTGLATPFIGHLVDRYGIRWVAVPMIFLFSASTAAIGLLSSSPLLFIGLYAIAGVMASGQTPLTYAKAIAAAFDRRRGLALGIAMAGVGLGTALVPKFTEVLVERAGWRGAYIGLGVLIAVVALPAMIWLVDGGQRQSLHRAAIAEALPGATAGEALRSATFWKLVAAFFAVSAATNGAIAHLVPLMTDRGVDASTATSVLGVAGLALIGGRLLAGYCLDRLFAPYVAAFFFAMPLVGISLLFVMHDARVATLAILLIGAGLGAEVDLIAYLQSRYLGLRAFGEIYGYLFAVFMLGAGLGPFVMGMGFQTLHSYDPPLYALGAALVCACVAVLRLGPYAFGVAEEQKALPRKSTMELAR